MNIQKLPNLPRRRYKVSWVILMLFNSLNAVGMNITSFPVRAQTASESVEVSPKIFLETPSAHQLIAQNLPNNQFPASPSIPRPRPPQPTPPQIPQTPPTEPPLDIAPPSESPQKQPGTPQQEQRKISTTKNCYITAPYQPPRTSEAKPLDSDTITVKMFIIKGSSVFSCKELKETLNKKDYFYKPLSLAELLQARSAITEMYIDKQYVTTGAYIPKQETQGEGAIVTIQVVEGVVKAEDIEVNGTNRLSKEYVRSRLRLGITTPLNEKKLLNALRLLQVNPLIDSISATLKAGVEPGINKIEVNVEEAKTWSSQVSTNNGRSPSVGSFRRGIGLTQNNLLGFGDRASINYNNTDGSDSFDISYELPLNPRNGTISFSYGDTSSEIIEKPFDEFDIDSDSRYYQLTLRQPIFQTPNQQFTLSLTASRNENQTSVRGIPSPISSGADSQGRSRVSAIRFAQEWVQQNRQQILSARSEFSLGIDAFNSTINEDEPDSRFFSWRGQFQWLRLFGLNTDNLLATPTLVFRTDVQLADEPLLPTEQLGFGGFGSIRGYRQDSLLTDNGVLASIEFRYPVWSKSKTAILLIPFVDVGTGWNSDSTQELDVDTLVSVGLGLQLIQSRNFSARLDWGIPLVNIDSEKRTWQENGVHFSVEYNPF
ncbi:MAG: ShlB/FhaC/HecB family hemolysin secretion/activation protein [Cyanobacteria bacterium J06629_18]